MPFIMPIPPPAAVSTDPKKIRWGRFINVSWVHSAEVSAPAASTSLVSKSVTSGKSGYIYGFYITAGEANDFLIKWTSGGSSYQIRVIFGGSGALQVVSPAAINEGLPADSSTVDIENVNAGSSGVVYQARLLYGEV